jgi:hypothetical protein
VQQLIGIFVTFSAMALSARTANDRSIEFEQLFIGFDGPSRPTTAYFERKSAVEDS